MRARLALLAALVLGAPLGAWLLMKRATPEAGTVAVLSAPPPAPRPTFEASAPDAFVVQLPSGDLHPATDGMGPNAMAERVMQDDATSIAGTVAYTTGEAAGPGMRVIAWPVDEPLAPDAMTDVWPPENAAETDAASAFRIEGLRPHVRYTVCAAGRGLYSPHGIHAFSAEPGTSDAVVKVARVYGVRVQLRDERGEPLRTHPSLGSHMWTLPRGAKIGLDLEAPLIGRIGLREAELAATTRDDFVLLCLGSAETPLPADVAGSVPGYEPYSRTVPLAPVSAGLETMEIRLRQVCEGFGILTVECTGSGPRLGAIPSLRGAMWLEMAPYQAQANVVGFLLRLDGPPWGGVSFENVPTGRYDTRLGGPNHLVVVPRDEEPKRIIDILPGDNRVSFDIGTVGAMELQVRREGGQWWTGYAHFQLEGMLDGVGVQATVSFRGPPYRVEALPTGRYRVTMTAPFQAVAETDAEADVLLDGSRLQSVTLQQTADAAAGR